jgi:hypothetical protein
MVQTNGANEWCNEYYGSRKTWLVKTLIVKTKITVTVKAVMKSQAERHTMV